MPDLEMPRMRGIDRFAVRFERRPGRKQGLRRPVQLAWGEAGRVHPNDDIVLGGVRVGHLG